MYNPPMIITNQTGNLLETNVQVIVHQANLYHTFGGGIAKAIAAKFPYAFDADKQTVEGDEAKLGGYSIGVNFNDGQPVVVNMYSQLEMTITSYDYMFKALSQLARQLDRLGFKTVGFPYNMGCGLADGNWEIVKVIIEQAFADTDIEVVIVKLPE